MYFAPRRDFITSWTLVVHISSSTSSSTTTMRATRATREGRMVGLLSSADVSRLPTSQASTRCVGSTGFQYKRKMEIKLRKTRRVSTTCVGSTGFQNRRYIFVENQHLLCRKELFEGGCTDENYYGYPEAKPCIMVSPKNFWQNFFKVHTLSDFFFR